MPSGLSDTSKVLQGCVPGLGIPTNNVRIITLFNNVQGIVSLFNLKRLKWFDLPKFPKPCEEVDR